MRWHLPSQRRDLQRHRFPVARILCDMPVLADSSRIRRNDQSVLAAANPCLLS